MFSCFTAFERMACMAAIMDLFVQKNDNSVTSVVVIDKDLQEQEAIKVNICQIKLKNSKNLKNLLF